MRFMEALTKLVIGTSRFGDHLLRRKVSGIIVAALAFACGAGLAHALKSEPTTTPAAVVQVEPADPARAEVSIGDTPAEDDEEQSAVFDKGSYANFAYGYSVEIPYGMVGVGSTPPAPQHGFGIDLDHPRSTEWNGRPEFPESYLYVDGSYNSLEWERLDDLVNAHLRYIREGGGNIHVWNGLPTRLGGLPATRLITLYEEDGVEMVSDEILSINGETGVVFTLSLSTPRSKYERDRPVLEAMQRSWCLQPVE